MNEKCFVCGIKLTPLRDNDDICSSCWRLPESRDCKE